MTFAVLVALLAATGLAGEGDDETTAGLALSLGVTIGFNVALLALAAAIAARGPGRLAAALGLNRFRARALWRPVAVMLGCYAMLAGYGAAVEALGVSALEPRGTVPAEVTRAPLTIALTGLSAVALAPLTEEVFYRGVVFGGLARWGFWPAAILSGAIFSAAHFDVGSLIPFLIIGVALAWLFWRRGDLWESVAFHVLFNAIGFSLLLATEAGA